MSRFKLSRRTDPIACPQCGQDMHFLSKLCNKCFVPSANLSVEGEQAKELGISLMRLRSLGGWDRLHRMSPEARAFIIKDHVTGESLKYRVGGLKRRGMMACNDPMRRFA